MTTTLNYTPPATIKEFIKAHRPQPVGEEPKVFQNWIIGPVGSGKTTGIFFKLIYMAKLQEPAPDGIRYTKAVIVRNTAPMLKDTTLKSWSYWFQHGVAGHWNATDKIFTLRFDDVHCEVLFRPLDTPDDVGRVLSLEVTFVLIDEFVEIPFEVVEALEGRCGRFPNSQIHGKATNFGMWGSSNPSTEDNWWYEYLHTANVKKIDLYNEMDNSAVEDDPKITYYHQPSGLSDHAENVENLPGRRNYYGELIKNKSPAWVKQFVESEWGYSVSGKPVVPTFKGELHISPKAQFDPLLDLVVGYDPGISVSAMIFGQMDLNGVLYVIGELVQSGYGAERLITERMIPYMRANFRGLDMNRVVIAPDPQAGARSANDEKTIVHIIKRFFPCAIETNNRLPLRLNAIEHFSTRITQAGPALVINGQKCPQLVRALKGGWKYIIDQKRNVEKPEPDKNIHSHPGDGFGYLCRYFHRGAERETRYGNTKFIPTPQNAGAYHVR
jgi:hypothetical protein